MIGNLTLTKKLRLSQVVFAVALLMSLSLSAVFNCLGALDKSDNQLADSLTKYGQVRLERYLDSLSADIGDLTGGQPYQAVLAQFADGRKPSQQIANLFADFMANHGEIASVMILRPSDSFTYSFTAGTTFFSDDFNGNRFALGSIGRNSLSFNQLGYYTGPEKVSGDLVDNGAYSLLQNRVVMCADISTPQNNQFMYVIFRPDFYFRMLSDLFDKGNLTIIPLTDSQTWSQVLLDPGGENILKKRIHTQAAAGRGLVPAAAAILFAAALLWALLGCRRACGRILEGLTQLAARVEKTSGMSSLDERYIKLGSGVSRKTLFSGVVGFFAVSTVLPAAVLAVLLSTGLALYGNGCLGLNNRQYAITIAARTGYAFEQSFHIINSFLNLPEVNGLFLADMSEGVPLKSYQTLIDNYSSIREVQPDISNFAFYSVDGESLYSSVFFDSEPLSRYSAPDLASLRQTQNSIVPFFSTAVNRQDGYITFGKKVYQSGDYYYTNNLLGYFIFSIDSSTTCNRDPQLTGARIYVCAEGPSMPEQVIWQSGPPPSPLQCSQNFVLEKSGPMLATSTPIAGFSGKLVVIQPYFGFIAAFFRPRYLILCGSLFTAALVLMYLATYQLAVRPVHDIIAIADEIVTDNSARRRSSSNPQNEVAILTEYFNRLIDRVNDLAYQNYQSSLKEKELMYLEKVAQVKALQQQINPHFLCNTLEVIKWTAIKYHADDITGIVVSLGKFYRNTIIRDNDWIITLGDELSNLQDYIYIQKQRFPDKFDVIYDIEPTVTCCHIPRLILQPLVENAIEHGFRNLESGGLISISGRLEGGIGIVRVADNGAGMSEAELTRLLARTFYDAPAGPGSEIGIAIPNVYKRLKFYSGGSCRFTITSHEGEGTKVEFSLPA